MIALGRTFLRELGRTGREAEGHEAATDMLATAMEGDAALHHPADGRTCQEQAEAARDLTTTSSAARPRSTASAAGAVIIAHRGHRITVCSLLLAVGCGSP